MPHTLAQGMYNNRLLEERGLDPLPGDIGVAHDEEFSRLKEAADSLAGRLNTQGHEGLKLSLKALKNCPGEIFYSLI